MKVKLSKNSPSNIAVGSARSCYNSTLITPEGVSQWNKKKDLLDDLFKSGHHTTMQHSTFTFEIEGISRLLIWRLFHSHGNYNSDQSSQRYAKIKPSEENYIYPKSVNKEQAKNLYEDLYKAYEKLSKELTIIFEKDSNPMVRKSASKKAMELARYVLPQSTKAHLYHSINLITALRYIKAAEIIPEAKNEAKELAKILEEEILKIEPEYKSLIEETKKQKAEFPNIDLNKFPLIKDSKNSIIFDINHGYGEPNNINYANGLNLNALFYPTETISGFTVRMKLSLSADAQNQRHRTSKGIREPLLISLEKTNSKPLEEKVFIPEIINKYKELKEIYLEAISKSFKFIENIKDIADKEDISYFLPNAFLIEVVERNDLSNFTHKAKLRTCINAQEEIRNITEEIIEELQLNGVEESFYLVPPCVFRQRANIKPYCSEGSRYCGIKIWKKEKYNS